MKFGISAVVLGGIAWWLYSSQQISSGDFKKVMYNGMIVKVI
jgi:hypothetical protein